MGLAHMLRVDKTALLCDLAETYNIYDTKLFPARYIAMLACGLKADSRIKTKMAGVQISPPNSLLFGLIVDELRVIRYLLVGKEKPTFITEMMEKGIEEKETKGFNTAEEYEAWRRKFIERVS